jgi:hypothetical protein
MIDRHCFYFFLSFLPDYVMHCRFSHTLSVNHYLFIPVLSSASWRGMVAPIVYRAPKCAVMDRLAALCSCWLESAEPLRTSMSVEWSYTIILLTWVLFESVCCLPSSPSYSEKFEPRQHLGTIFTIHSLPGLGRIQYSPKLCSCSDSWGFASDALNTSRLWVLITWRWLWSVSGWCVLLNYTTMQVQHYFKLETNLLDRLSKKSSVSNFIKIRQRVVEMFQADGRTDGQTQRIDENNSRFS